MSRILRDEEAAGVGRIAWRSTAPAASAGVEPLRLRRIGGPAAAPEPAPEPPAPKAPPPPPPPPPPPAVDLEAERRKAYQQGFAEGEKAAAARLAQQQETRFASLVKAVGELAGYKDELRRAVEREAVELAFAVARRIVRRELTIDPRTTLAMVRSCLADCSSLEVRQIRLSPADHALIGGELDVAAEIVADAALQPGEAVFETSQGRLDARLETQLDEIARGLADA